MITSVLVILRILVGMLVIKTGADLAQGHLAFSGYSGFEPFITGLFVILVGIHIIFSSIFK